MKQIILAVAVLCALSGCMKTRHYVNGNSVAGARAVKDDNDYFISGLAQEKETHAAVVCGDPRRVVATETFQSPLNIILGIITFGIYTPQEHTVYCR